MESVKLTKNTLKLHPADLLIKLGATIESSAFPQHVYFSKEDYKLLRQNLIKHIKKVRPEASSKWIQWASGLELLNYGPNESLANAIKPGYCLVGREAIKKANK